MSESVSRILAGAWAVLLLAPVSALALFYSWLLTGLYFTGAMWEEPASVHFTAVFMLACIAFLLAAWWIMGVFVIAGRRGLARVGTAPLAIVALGAILTLASLIVVNAWRLGVEAGWTDWYPAAFFAFGAPALIPFAHLWIEWRRARRAAAAPHQLGRA